MNAVALDFNDCANFLNQLIQYDGPVESSNSLSSKLPAQHSVMDQNY